MSGRETNEKQRKTANPRNSKERSPKEWKSSSEPGQLATRIMREEQRKAK